MFEIRLLEEDHIEAALALWRATPHIGLSSADEPERLQRFLERNRGCSFVALAGDRVVGTSLCGHDGRRGYLYHVAVAAEWQGNGLGSQLVERSLAALREQGIGKCHAFVFREDPHRERFWEPKGWERRDEIVVYSYRCGEGG